MSTDPIHVRATGTADLAFVLSTEQDPSNAPYIGQWAQARHERAIASPNEAHFIIERGASGAALKENRANHINHPVGYIILIGLSDPHSAVNLRRIVVTQKGQGYGRRALRWVKTYVFETLGIHRLWFDVIASNHRAQDLYKSEGFILEGTLRDGWKTASSYEDMLILSMLEHEYRTSLLPAGQ